MNTTIRRVEKLEKCALWEGSLEQAFHEQHGLRASDIDFRIAEYEKRDDLSQQEQQYLKALKKTLRRGE